MTQNAKVKTAGALALSLWLRREKPKTDTYRAIFGVAPSTVYRWCNGEARPSAASVARIERVTGGFVLAGHWEGSP